jgi:SRSO17 transposase
MVAEATLGAGVLVRDDTGFPQPGKASVGVARQYAGTLGNVGHGQSAVTCGDTAPHAAWPVAVQLYWPRSWADDPARRQPARVPAHAPLQPKPAVALQLLEQARAWGGPHRGVGADADDGDNPPLLAGVEARPERSVVGVRADWRVRPGRAAAGPVPRADRRLQALPRWPWRTIRWRHGTTGWHRTTWVAVRCGRDSSAGQRHGGGLLGERASRGQPEARKSCGSNRPAAAAGEEVAGAAPRRYAGEPCHEEATGELGWDQDQGRLWIGVHRHAVTGTLADSVLAWLELQRRRRHHHRGRPRAPFSPSPRSTAGDASSRPS